ncbi:MAG: hypothetical protein DHS80DRAFT_32725 [Piptocephalis tieghemiana]|nr:MAG: hypothetical protein DHS80DRAFT_32725 [Piptocephalis tieghemiana]
MKNLLVFGGVEPLGRAIALHALQVGEYGRIRVVDRQVPEVAFFQYWERAQFNKVEFYHMNIGSPNSDMTKIDRAFSLPEGEHWDLVIHAYYDCIYEESMKTHVQFVTERARLVGEGAKRYHARLLLYITRIAYAKWTPKMGVVKEDHVLTPWKNNIRSTGEVRSEETIRSIQDLPLLILRVADVYGYGLVSSVDSNCVSIRLQKDAEHPTFGCIYSDEDRIDTLHAEDAARAVFHTAHWYIDTQKKGTQIFNVKDDSDLSFLAQTKMLCDIFDIPCRFYSAPLRMLSKAALRIGWIADLVIKRCQDAWIEALNRDGISYTPIQYVLDREMLATTWGASLDKSLLERETGFRCLYPQLTPEIIREVLEYWIKLKAWPRNTLGN